MTRRLPVLTILIFICTAPHAAFAKSPEPEEDQMRAAFAETFTGLKDHVSKMAARCRAEGSLIVNPFLAMKCVQICAGDPEACQPAKNVEIEIFTKLGCAAAAELPGWNCDFRYRLNTRDNPIQEMFEEAYGSDEYGRGRFLQKDGEWLMIPPEK